ncbi:MAG: thioredoxin family protein [Fibrobacterales bacterium]
MNKILYGILFLAITSSWAFQGEEHAIVTARYSKGAVTEASQLIVDIIIDDGWHITSDSPEDEYLIPAQIEVSAKNITFGDPKFPKPEVLYVKVLDMTTTQFSGDFVVTVPVAERGTAFSKTDSLSTVIDFTYQPCDDKMCLPPVTTSIVVGGESHRPAETDAVSEPIDDGSLEKSGEETSFGMMILLAILGGLILNLMPCVLPVLSLKVFSLVKQAGESRAKLLKLGGAFSLGIAVSFWVLAGSVVILRSAGSLVGWGFQFQNPLFIIVMAAIMLIFALNLFGVFEIFLPTSANSKLSLMSGKSGYVGAFFNGVLMTLLSTPCSAPFLGSAMGFAFSQPAIILFIMFTAVAFGLALPYMILTLFPFALKWVPKPGNWMLRLKEFMGFLLIATVLWLLTVLTEAYGSDLATWTSVFLLVLAINAWFYSHALPNGGFGLAIQRKVFVWIVILATSFGAYMWLVQPTIDNPGAQEQLIGEGEIEYSEQNLARVLESGKPVFLDFTASWCITCKTNKKLVLKTESMRQEFAQKGITYMVADWTDGDEHITKKLKSFGRAGVPLYVVYSPKNPKNPIVLPELITADIVLDALSEL